MKFFELIFYRDTVYGIARNTRHLESVASKKYDSSEGGEVNELAGLAHTKLMAYRFFPRSSTIEIFGEMCGRSFEK